MFIKLRNFKENDKENFETIYAKVQDIEISQTISGSEITEMCFIHMTFGFQAIIYDYDIPMFIEAFERNDHIFDFSLLSSTAEFINQNGDLLSGVSKEIK